MERIRNRCLGLHSEASYVKLCHLWVAQAFMHSWTVAARPHYAKTNIRIFEIIPPAVRSNLGGSHDYGEDCAEFCSAVFSRFAKGELEVGFRASEESRLASRDKLDSLFDSMTKASFEDKYKLYEGQT